VAGTGHGTDHQSRLGWWRRQIQRRLKTGLEPWYVSADEKGTQPGPIRGDAMRRFWLWMLIVLIVIVVLVFAFVLLDSLPKLIVWNS
jgi:hypothetical protein